MARNKKKNQTAMDRSDRRADRRRQSQSADDFGYSYEEESAITLDSLRKSKRYLIIALAFLILVVFLVVGYMFMYNNSIIQKRNTCWLHQQQIEQFATQYVNDNGLASYPAYVEDIPNFASIDMKCPDGGGYTWNPVAGVYYCSEHGHWPSGFNQAQSINQGTQTMVVENKQ